jgi:hypothetical protein
LSWLEESQCQTAKVLGVAVRSSAQEYAFKPVDLEDMAKDAIKSIGFEVAFTMVSDITSTICHQLSPQQSEIVIEQRGVRIPVVESLDMIPSRSFEFKQSLACIIKNENMVLIYANALESAILCGSEVEKMLMEMVRFPLFYNSNAKHC